MIFDCQNPPSREKKAETARSQRVEVGKVYRVHDIVRTLRKYTVYDKNYGPLSFQQHLALVYLVSVTEESQTIECYEYYVIIVVW